MKQFLKLLVSVVLGCTACNSNVQQENKPAPVAAAEKPLPAGASLLQLDEQLQDADSLVFVFYKDPLGKDSLRYTRYFGQYHSTDTAVIQVFKQSLSDTTQLLNKVMPCRSEGKIWCFNKGKIFQTIYFADYNKDCSFIYIIRNGQFYYSNLHTGFAKKLKELRAFAREVPNEGM